MAQRSQAISNLVMGARMVRLRQIAQVMVRATGPPDRRGVQGRTGL